MYVLNIIIGAMFDESILTPGREIERQTVHFCRTHFQLVHLLSSVVGVQGTESAAFLQRG